jgi:hypothetical protein
VESISGPIMLVANDRLGAWPGIEPGEDWPGEVVVPGVLAIVEIGDGIGLMLHADYSCDYTAWEPASGGGGALVQDVAYQGDQAADALAAVPASAWHKIARTFRVGARGAMLFDGAWQGSEAGETGFEIDLAPGEYVVEAIPRFEHGPVVARYVRLTPL